MKIYVAAKYELKEIVRKLYGILTNAGHQISYDWTGEEVEEPHKIAHEEVSGVLACDALVILPHERGKGQYTELGVALASRKRIFVFCTGISKGWNIFLHHRECEYVRNEAVLLDRLRILEGP